VVAEASATFAKFDQVARHSGVPPSKRSARHPSHMTKSSSHFRTGEFLTARHPSHMTKSSSHFRTGEFLTPHSPQLSPHTSQAGSYTILRKETNRWTFELNYSYFRAKLLLFW